MNVVFDSANGECRALPLLKYASLVSEQFALDRFWNPGPSVLGTVHQMNQILHERLSHGRLPFLEWTPLLLRPFRA